MEMATVWLGDGLLMYMLHDNAVNSEQSVEDIEARFGNVIEDFFKDKANLVTRTTWYGHCLY